MILPVIYACVVWYLAMRWRRQWPSFATVATAVGVLCLLGMGARSLGFTFQSDAHLPIPIDGPLRHPVVEALLWPYAAMVFCIGMYIACLPRSAPSEAHCRACHYDLSAMDPEGLVCPECGAQPEYRCLACGCDLSGRSPVNLRCPDCCTAWAGPGHAGFPGWEQKLIAADLAHPGPVPQPSATATAA